MRLDAAKNRFGEKKSEIRDVYMAFWVDLTINCHLDGAKISGKNLWQEFGDKNLVPTRIW